MSYTDLIGTQADYMQPASIQPRYSPCPQCEMTGARKHVITRRIAHVAALHRRSWIVAAVGGYQARGACCKYFQAAIPGGPHRGRSSCEVRNTVANALMRDRMPYRSVMRRMQEASLLRVSLGSLHACFLWAHEQSTMATHWEFVCPNCSGVLCMEEVHDSGRTIFFATDPLGDLTGSVKVVDTTDQAPMDLFLQARKERGLKAEGGITEGSPLYTDSLQRDWAEVAHQRCILHVIKDVNKLSLDGGRALKNRRKRQGHKGRKKHRGRPSHKAYKQSQYRQGMSQKEPAACLWEPQSLRVRTQEDRSEQDKQDLALLVKLAPALKRFREFNQRFSRLVERGITKHCARSRRTRRVHHPLYHATAFLAKALKKIGTAKFDQMLVFLGWENGQRTNNQVERNTRVFRMMQKTRYKRRKPHTIAKALELALYARMVEHPVYRHNVGALRIPCREKSSLPMAA
jgi:hypothetical protein